MIEQPDKRSTNQWWRWALMPVAAVAGTLFLSFLVSIVYTYFSKVFLEAYVGAGVTRFNANILASLCFGYVYISIACAVAPRGKFVVGVVMAGLFLAYVIVTDVAIWVSSLYEVSGAIWESICSLVALMAAAAALFQVHRESGRGAP